MRPRDLLWRVELPLAAPVILAGIRTAAVISVGTATLAAFIGAGGLGDPIVTGLTVTDTNLVLSGALPAAALALVVDARSPASSAARRRAGCDVAMAASSAQRPGVGSDHSAARVGLLATRRCDRQRSLSARRGRSPRGTSRG